MIDFHTHILPGMDDGSRDVETSASMLYEEYKQGVHKIVATPHFYADRDSVEAFLSRRKQSYAKIEKMLPTLEEKWRRAGDVHAAMPSVMLGAEVYYFEGIGRAEQIRWLCIDKTNILMLELPFCQWGKELIVDVKKMHSEHGLEIVLAHVERYLEFQKDKSVWDELISMPVYPQMNAGGFLKWQRRHKCLKILKNVQPVLLGSDCHNMTSRMPNLKDGRDVIQQKAGGQVLQETDSLGEELLDS